MIYCQIYPELLNLTSPSSSPSPSPLTLTSTNTMMSPVTSSIHRFSLNNNNNISHSNYSKVNWIQLSGHDNTFTFDGPDILYKKCTPDGFEVNAYESMVEDVNMKPYIPMYRGTVTVNKSFFIAIDNLLYSFDNPFIMDIKMGSRTFLEDEVSNDEPRPDLFDKMFKLNPNSLSSEDISKKAITKLKYMQLREQLSSSSNLGFRIEAYKTDTKQTAPKDLSFVKSRDEVKNCLQQFLPTRQDQLDGLISRLLSMQSSLKKSSFFSSHEVIGSSLLMVYDKSEVGVWMIDFAKTAPLPKDIYIDHSSPWIPGNHEDGYLYGLQNLIDIVNEFQSLDK